ncbi:cysteine dioxygenase [Jatrophihabitans sp. YIM 134969]
MTSTLLPAVAGHHLPADDQPLAGRRLGELTRWYAAELAAGRFGPVRYGDPARPGDPDARWHVRVHADDLIDVWVISWLPSQSTQLHDHGGSAGAFTVVRGVLTESVWSPGRRDPSGRRHGGLHDREHRARTTVAFGTDRVHDVRNLGTEPAVSVHVYSRPLRRMGYFDVQDGSLQLTSVLDTTDPEPAS